MTEFGKSQLPFDFRLLADLGYRLGFFTPSLTLRVALKTVESCFLTELRTNGHQAAIRYRRC